MITCALCKTPGHNRATCPDGAEQRKAAVAAGGGDQNDLSDFGQVEPEWWVSNFIDLINIDDDIPPVSAGASASTSKAASKMASKIATKKQEAADRRAAEEAAAAAAILTGQKRDSRAKWAKLMNDLFTTALERLKGNDEGEKARKPWGLVRQKLCPLTDLDVELSKLLRARIQNIKDQKIKRTAEEVKNFKTPLPVVILKVKKKDEGKPGAKEVKHFACPWVDPDDPSKSCDKVQARQTDYRKHYITHTKLRPYHCRQIKTDGVICMRAFRDAATRCRHEATHKVEYFNCQHEDCTASFKCRLDNLRNHQRTQHPGWKPPGGDPKPSATPQTGELKRKGNTRNGTTPKAKKPKMGPGAGTRAGAGAGAGAGATGAPGGAGPAAPPPPEGPPPHLDW